MRKTLESITGILVSVFFIAGFFVLFFYNPQTLAEINNVSLTVYNLEGMKGRVWAEFVIYLSVGAFTIVFASLLPVPPRNAGMILTSRILLLASGITWLSFGLFPYDVNSDLGTHLMLGRIIIVVIAGSIGLLLLGAGLETILKNRFLKWYTLLTALLMILLGLISLSVFDASWVRTNVSFAVFFVWFGIYGSDRLTSP